MAHIEKTPARTSVLKVIEIGLTTVSILIGGAEVLGRTGVIEGPTPIQRIQNEFDQDSAEVGFNKQVQEAEKEFRGHVDESHERFCEGAAEYEIYPASCDEDSNDADFDQGKPGG